MTSKQINAAIAKACGWKAKGNTWVTPNETPVFATDLPDYCNDLNAMHEAERAITDKGVNAWWIYCGNIVRSMPAIFGNETAVMATARQRAEAFLKTLGKWEEVQG